MDEVGFLTDAELRIAQALVPIVCVDALPVEVGPSGCRILLIRRLDAYGRTAWNLVGGRVRYGEGLVDALKRHVVETLGTRAELLGQGPQVVAEYPHGDEGTPHDPRQHAIGLSYVVSLESEPVAAGEALDLAWFPVNELPDPGEFGFGQSGVVAELAMHAQRLQKGRR